MELVLILVFSFFLRLIFIFGKNTDDYGHLWRIKHIKEVMKFQPTKNSIIKAPRVLPPLNHFLISITPFKNKIFVGKILNIIYDIVLILITYYVSKFLFETLNIKESSQLSIVATLLTATTPLFFPINARLKALGARTLGGLLSFIFIFCYIFAISQNIFLLHIISFIIIIIIFFSSQFFTQFALGFLFLSTFFFLTIAPLYYFLGILIFIIVFQRFGTKKILKYHIEFFKWYKRNWHGGPLPERNKLDNFLSFPKDVFLDKKKAFMTFYYNNSYIILAYSLPILSLGIYYLILGDGEYFKLLKESEDLFLITMGFLIAFAMFILTSLRPFLVLGQAERYFEPYVPFLNIIYIVIIQSESTDIQYDKYLLLLLLNLIVVLINLVGANIDILKRNLNTLLSREQEGVVEFLKTLGKSKIITLPLKEALVFSCYDEINSYYFEFCLKDDGFNYMDNDSLKYSYFNPKYEYLNKKYGIDIVVFNKHNISQVPKQKAVYITEELEKIYENTTYLVYKVSIE